ncbi:hypothetical protein A6452_35240 [Bradyrhizobium elkanii]|nr:hypothetical protein A6452_35240 [Bradyrhizobium elkanii]
MIANKSRTSAGEIFRGTKATGPSYFLFDGRHAVGERGRVVMRSKIAKVVTDHREYPTFEHLAGGIDSARFHDTDRSWFLPTLTEER